MSFTPIFTFHEPNMFQYDSPPNESSQEVDEFAAFVDERLAREGRPRHHRNVVIRAVQLQRRAQMAHDRVQSVAEEYRNNRTSELATQLRALVIEERAARRAAVSAENAVPITPFAGWCGGTYRCSKCKQPGHTAATCMYSAEQAECYYTYWVLDVFHKKYGIPSLNDGVAECIKGYHKNMVRTYKEIEAMERDNSRLRNSITSIENELHQERMTKRRCSEKSVNCKRAIHDIVFEHAQEIPDRVYMDIMKALMIKD
jgi:hypothetical protein